MAKVGLVLHAVNSLAVSRGVSTKDGDVHMWMSTKSVALPASTSDLSNKHADQVCGGDSCLRRACVPRVCPATAPG
jgi:hypothetical protein